MASLGLPGLAGFWGEMLAMLAAYSTRPPRCRSTTYLVFMVLAGVGAVLTTAYFVGVRSGGSARASPAERRR